MDITIEELDAKALTDTQIAALNRFTNKVRAEARPEDPPEPLEAALEFFRNIPSYIDAVGFHVSGDDGDWVATSQAIALNTGDNEHVLQATVSVLPEHRNQGLGRQLLAKVAEVAERWNRTLLIGSTNERVPAGAAFAERIGADAGLSAHTNRLVLADVDRAMITQWIDEGPKRAAGYSLVGFDGRCPDELVDDVVDVLHVMNDQPRDKLQIEDQTITVEQFREQEQLAFATGGEAWWLFARHDETGNLAGLTDVHWDPNQPETVFQGNTGVRPEHRGHAVGKWLKAAMLLRILDERPGVADIRTGNADSNDAMLGINRQLGFKPFIANTTWQVSLDQVRAYLAAT